MFYRCNSFLSEKYILLCTFEKHLHASQNIQTEIVTEWSIDIRSARPIRHMTLILSYSHMASCTMSPRICRQLLKVTADNSSNDSFECRDTLLAARTRYVGCWKILARYTRVKPDYKYIEIQWRAKRQHII